jgi:GntR family transcriptional regulator of arabinose operon
MPNARWDEIAQSLRDAIHQGTLRTGDRLPSETVLAAQWEVCRMTAHRAMVELEREGLVTRKRRAGTVVAERTAPPVSDRNKADKVRHVALIAFFINDFPQVDYLHGFRTGLPRNCHLLLCDTDNKPANEAEYLRRLKSEADAICLYASCAPGNTPLLQELVDAGKPVVCLDRLPEGLEVDAFLTDNHASVLQALRTLTARGHRRIAFFGTDNPTVSSIRDRYIAYREALAEVGETDPTSLVRLFPPGIGYDFEIFAQGIYDALFTMRHLPDPPTAIFCQEDYFLAAAWEACERLGLKVPGNMEIVSFSDCPPLAPRLTRNVHRLRQAAHDMGRCAAERLHARLEGTLSSDTAPEVVRLSATLHAATHPIAAPAVSLSSEVSL